MKVGRYLCTNVSKVLIWNILKPRVQVSVKKTLARVGPHGQAKLGPKRGGYKPLCIPVKRSFSTVSSYIWPNSSKIGRRSFSSRFLGIWPTNSLIASWSFIGMVGGWVACPFWPGWSGTGPFASAAILNSQTQQQVQQQTVQMKFARASYLHTSMLP